MLHCTDIALGSLGCCRLSQDGAREAMGEEPGFAGGRRMPLKAPSTYVHMSVCMHACMHACMYVCMYIGMYVHMCAYMCVRVYVHSQVRKLRSFWFIEHRRPSPSDPTAARGDFGSLHASFEHRRFVGFVRLSICMLGSLDEI